MSGEWTYEEDDFNEELPFVELQFGIEDLHLLYKSVSVHLDKWPGGDPEEQERLQQAAVMSKRDRDVAFALMWHEENGMEITPEFKAVVFNTYSKKYKLA